MVATMMNNIPPWVIFLGFVLLLSNPRLFIVLVIGYTIYRVIRSMTDDVAGKGKFGDFSDVINREFGDIFKPKKSKPIDVTPRSKKTNISFSPPRMTPSQIWKAALSGIAVLLVVFVIIDGFVDVKPGNAAVIFDRGRGVLEEPLTEGLHLKIPFWQEATKFQTKKQEFNMAGEYKGVDDVDAVRGRSKDGQDVFIDATITFQVDAADTPFLRRQFINEASYKTNIVYPGARSVIYDAIGQFNALELISDKREDFRNYIATNLQQVYGDNRIQFREVFIRKITFSPEFASAIEEKQIAEQRIKTAENRKLEAEELKQKTIIEAEGEAEAIRLKGEALQQNPEVIQLQFVEKMSPSINWGILPDGALPLIDLKSLQGQ